MRNQRQSRQIILWSSRKQMIFQIITSTPLYTTVFWAIDAQLLTPHDNRISPFPCLPACPRVPACLCIKSSAHKWIWSSGLGQGRTKAFLSWHLSWVCQHIVFACLSADQQQLCWMKQSSRRNAYDGDFVKVKVINTTKRAFWKLFQRRHIKTEMN